MLYTLLEHLIELKSKDIFKFNLSDSYVLNTWEDLLEYLMRKSNILNM